MTQLPSGPRKYFKHRLEQDVVMKTTLCHLGAAVRRLRQRAGLTLQALGERAGCSRHTINNIEQARNWPAMVVYLRICKALGVGKPPLT